MSKRNEQDVIVAAQRGDRRAREKLARTYLPLVYNVVGRALGDHPDIDDVVQEVMLRVMRNLPALRRPESIRAWVLAITVHEIGAHQHANAAEHRTGPADRRDPADRPDPGADFEQLAVLRLRLSGERRQVAQATRWLDGEERAVLAVWWQEAAGQLTRAETAAALQTTAAYAAVRIQRTRTLLERGRSIVAALEASPRCAELDTAITAWDGRPSPLWRKRIDRHVRDCQLCLSSSRHAVPVERLLIGCALVPVPAALTAAVLAKVSAGAGSATAGAETQVRLAGRLVRTAHANPVAAMVTTAVVLATGAGFAYTGAPDRPQPVSHTVAQAPSAPRSNSPKVSPTPGPTPTKSATAKKAKAAAAPSPSQAGCGAGLSTIWANWPMPNPKMAGLPHPASYTNLGDGTVRDNVTCLIWQQDPAPKTYTFTAAKSYCADLDLDGDGWHLPSRVELTSIVDTTRQNPAIDTTAFPGTTPRYFWTSSPWAVTKEPLRAWIINFYEGLTSNAAYQSGEYNVRCVRSTDGTGRPAYRVADGEAHDPATDLTWQRAISPSMPADAASSYCADLGLGGHTWRLPSVQELATTVDETRVSPAIDTEAFPGTAKNAPYWTATRPSPRPAQRWALNYNDGFTTYRQADAGYARCVR